MTRVLPEDLDARLDDLLLDRANPRLSAGMLPDEQLTQADLVERLYTDMAVDEVALSIAANGFYPEERLLVIKAEAANPQKYIVVEGNRRLVAVLVLLDAGLRRRLKATDLPIVSKQRVSELQLLPVSIYPDRQSLWSYLGFRHINGTKAWDAYSKAQYIADVHEQYNVPLDEIASRIGDRHSTVVRLYRGLKVLRQAEQTGVFDVEDRVRGHFSFSHLYTALDQPAYQSLIGIDAVKSLKRDPVPKAKMSELQELLTWLYGRKSTDTEPLVQSQNPDLNTLREVISTVRGLSALRSGYGLSVAHEVSVGDERRFRDSLTRATEELRRASGTVIGGYHGEEDLLATAETAQEIATKLVADMKDVSDKPTSRQRRRN